MDQVQRLTRKLDNLQTVDFLAKLMLVGLEDVKFGPLFFNSIIDGTINHSDSITKTVGYQRNIPVQQMETIDFALINQLNISEVECCKLIKTYTQNNCDEIGEIIVILRYMLLMASKADVSIRRTLYALSIFFEFDLNEWAQLMYNVSAKYAEMKSMGLL